LSARSGWRRAGLALNTANLAASSALIAGGAWAALTERGWPAPAVLVRAYGPMLAALHWYGGEPVGVRALAALLGVLSVILVLACVLFSFKAHLEEIAVILLGIPFYLLIACSSFLVAGLAVSLVRLL
jgi:hypothetical protein